MSTTANLVGMIVHAVATGGAYFLLAPVPGRIEEEFAHEALCTGFFINVVRFLAEWLKFGRWPDDAPYVTNYVRYIGAGLGALGFIGSFALLSRGGVRHTVATVKSAAVYYAALLIAALAITSKKMVIGMYVLAVVAFLHGCMNYMMLRTSRKRFAAWITLIVGGAEAFFIALAGLNLLNTGLLHNDTEDVLFLVASLLAGGAALIAYVGGVERLAFWEPFMEPTRSSTSSSSSTTEVAVAYGGMNPDL